MKNLVIMTLLLSVSAFASKARLEALGEDSFGSQYVDDNRNMFLNAAQIHNHNDFVQFDFGSSVTVDQESTPKATGSYFEQNDNAVWGVTFGQNSNTANNLRSGMFGALLKDGAINATQFAGLVAAVRNENVLDLFYGQKSSNLNWGVRLSYSDSKNEEESTGLYDESEQTGYLVGLGLSTDKWDFYANIGATNKAKLKNVLNSGNNFDFKGEIGVQAGAIYDVAEGKAFVEVRNITVNENDFTDTQNKLDGKWSISKITLGYGREEKMNDIFTAFYKGYFSQDTQTNKGFVDGNDVKETKVAASIGMEAQANSWLTLRGSVSNNLLGEEDVDGDKKTIADAVDVAFGATLSFGDVELDGLVANDSNADGTGGDDNGNLRSDSLMTRVSMTYNF